MGLLQRALRGGRLPHAFVFCGPEGVGRESVARAFAQVLLCADPQERAWEGEGGRLWGLATLREACGVCEPCVLTAAGTHPDLHVVHRHLHRYHPDAAVRQRRGARLGVDVIRHFLTEPATRAAYRGGRKVFIVAEAERLSEAAQNALLKTLEEPPGDAVIILIAESRENLLPTIRSRCQAIPFGLLPEAFVAARLREEIEGLEEDEAGFLAAMFGGRIGPAVRAHELGILEHREALLSAVLALVREMGEARSGKPAGGSVRARAGGRTPAAGKAWAEATREAVGAIAKQIRAGDPEVAETEAAREAGRLVLGVVSAGVSDLLRLAAGVGRQRVVPAGAREAARAAEILGTRGCRLVLEAIERAERDLAVNASVDLVLETVGIEVGRIAGGSRLPVVL